MDGEKYNFVSQARKIRCPDKKPERESEKARGHGKKEKRKENSIFHNKSNMQEEKRSQWNPKKERAGERDAGKDAGI